MLENRSRRTELTRAARQAHEPTKKSVGGGGIIGGSRGCADGEICVLRVLGFCNFFHLMWIKDRTVLVAEFVQCVTDGLVWRLFLVRGKV